MRAITGSSNDRSSASDSARDTLGHTDEGHGSQVLGYILDLFHGLRSRSEGSIDHEDHIFEIFVGLTHLFFVSFKDLGNLDDVRNFHVGVGGDFNKNHSSGLQLFWVGSEFIKGYGDGGYKRI